MLKILHSFFLLISHIQPLTYSILPAFKLYLESYPGLSHHYLLASYFNTP